MFKDLKGKVLSTYKQYGNAKITDKLVIDYIIDLEEEERARLKVNSFTQGQLTKMISNISEG